MAIERSPQSAGLEEVPRGYRPPGGTQYTVQRKGRSVESFLTIAADHGLDPWDLISFNFPGCNARRYAAVVNWYLHHHFDCPNTRDGKNRRFRGGETIYLPPGRCVGVPLGRSATTSGKPLRRDDLPEELRPVYDDFMRQMGAYMKAVRPRLVEALGIDSGTLTNLESGLFWLMITIARVGMTRAHTDGPGSLDRQLGLPEVAEEALRSGCEAISAKTYQVVQSSLKRHGLARVWLADKYMIGNVFEHHAVRVRLRNCPGQEYVFDPWINQRPEVYTLEVWKKRFPHYRALGRARSE